MNNPPRLLLSLNFRNFCQIYCTPSVVLFQSSLQFEHFPQITILETFKLKCTGHIILRSLVILTTPSTSLSYFPATKLQRQKWDNQQLTSKFQIIWSCFVKSAGYFMLSEGRPSPFEPVHCTCSTRSDRRAGMDDARHVPAQRRQVQWVARVGIRHCWPYPLQELQ